MKQNQSITQRHAHVLVDHGGNGGKLNKNFHTITLESTCWASNVIAGGGDGRLCPRHINIRGRHVHHPAQDL
jgi:hypothetical protein